MNLTRILLGLIFLVLIGMAGLSCKKEFKVDEVDKSTAPFISIDARAANSVSLYNLPDGSSVIINNAGNGASVDGLLLHLDPKGNISSKNYFGKSKNDFIYSSTVDDEGNIYVVGSTMSPELQMSTISADLDYPDAYLAKLSPDGSLLWQKGYCDTLSNPIKGAYADFFFSVHYLNGKIYCIGSSDDTSTIQTNRTDKPWVVCFDKNGVFQNIHYLPNHKRFASGNFIFPKYTNSLKLSNGDLIIRQVQGLAGNKGDLSLTGDTLGFSICYDPVNDVVKWKVFDVGNSTLSDVYAMGETGDGAVVFFNSRFKIATKVNKSTGAIIESYPLSLGNNLLHFSIDFTKTFRVGDDLYIVGGEVNNDFARLTIDGCAEQGIFAPDFSKPWIMKLNREGKLVYSKAYDISDAMFSHLEKDNNGNLQLLGYKRISGSFESSPFLLTLNLDGTILNK